MMPSELEDSTQEPQNDPRAEWEPAYIDEYGVTILPYRRRIELTHDEYEMVNGAIEGLERRPDLHLYTRGPLLVHPIRAALGPPGLLRPTAGVTIAPVSLARLRECISDACLFFRRKMEGRGAKRTEIEEQVKVPRDVVEEVLARREWPRLRALTGLAEAPMFRPDGSLIECCGYDQKTGLFVELDEAALDALAEVPERPSQSDSRFAVQQLVEVVEDFNFEDGAGVSAWLSLVLSRLARFAFMGPVPLTLVDAPVEGAGKGLLVDAASMIVSGSELPRMPPPGDDNEMRKRILTIALAGDACVLIDNVSGRVAWPSLSAALTSTTWKDRILGRSADAELPLSVIWCMTGNNVVVDADTARRSLHIRLRPKVELPELRDDFRHPQLREWIIEERPRLLAAALTVMKAFFVARPSVNLPYYGSFEGWSSVVRAAIVYSGLNDPCASTLKLRRTDPFLVAARALLEALEPLTVSSGITTRAIAERSRQPIGDANVLGDALATLCDDDRPSNKAVAGALRRLKERVVGPWVLVHDGGRTPRWRVERTAGAAREG